MDQIYDFESALAEQIRITTDVKKIPLTESLPRDIQVAFRTPLMRIKKPQSAGHSSVKVLSPDTQRQYL
jgi:hypothetical protein